MLELALPFFSRETKKHSSLDWFFPMDSIWSSFPDISSPNPRIGIMDHSLNLHSAGAKSRTLICRLQEAQCWVPLLKASKVVLAGDHLQLPPTIKSLNSKTKTKSKDKDKESEDIIKGMTLEKTLFDRLLSLHGPGIKV